MKGKIEKICSVWLLCYEHIVHGEEERIYVRQSYI